jgi:hypothetical protein
MAEVNNFKVTGRMEGKHRILWEGGKQELADDAKLALLREKHKEIGSQDKFPSEQRPENVRTGNMIYDAALEGALSLIEKLTKRVQVLESLVKK